MDIRSSDIDLHMHNIGVNAEHGARLHVCKLGVESPSY